GLWREAVSRELSPTQAGQKTNFKRASLKAEREDCRHSSVARPQPFVLEAPRGDDETYHQLGRLTRAADSPIASVSLPSSHRPKGGSIVNAAYLMLTTAWLAGADPVPGAPAAPAAPIVASNSGCGCCGGTGGGYSAAVSDCCDSGRKPGLFAR